MRTLKFRAWDTEKKSMLYFPLSNTGDTFQICFDGSNYRTLDHVQGISGPVDIMQFTGLRDMNGKDIYEGDIVKTEWFKGGVKPYQVIYQAPSFVMKVNKNSKTWTEFELKYTERQFQEIIGNIYENPDLLK